LLLLLSATAHCPHGCHHELLSLRQEANLMGGSQDGISLFTSQLGFGKLDLNFFLFFFFLDNPQCYFYMT
jgi:hypothetical protein